MDEKKELCLITQWQHPPQEERISSTLQEKGQRKTLILDHLQPQATWPKYQPQISVAMETERVTRTSGISWPQAMWPIQVTRNMSLLHIAPLAVERHLSPVNWRPNSVTWRSLWKEVSMWLTWGAALNHRLPCPYPHHPLWMTQVI